MAITTSTLLQYAVPFLLPLFFFLLKTKLFTSTDQGKKKHLPPSPPTLPIIGNLHQLSSLPHRSLGSLSRKYGDLMLLHLGSKPAVVVSSAEAAFQIMKTHDLIFCSRPQWKILTQFLNNGNEMISAPYGDYWRNLRSICVLELLSKKRVESFRKVREEEVNLMVENIKRSASAVVDMRQIFEALNTDVISRVALGRKLEGDTEIKKFAAEGSELIGKFSIGEFVPCLAWIDRVVGVTTRLSKLSKRVDVFLEKVIADSGKGDGDEDQESCGTKDFIQVLHEVQRGGDTNGYKPIDRESIKGLLLDMFLGGTETSSTAMEWMMSELLRSPRVMKKLQHEVVETAKGKGEITEDDLKNMVYLKATLKETLRLHPPSPLQLRESSQDVEINGYDISQGSIILINGWTISRDPKHWEEPNDFVPDRFLDSSADFEPSYCKMLPFGFGRRGCPGELFGITVMELAMANLLLQFSWALPLGVERKALDMTERPGMTLLRVVPLLAVATPKSSLREQT